MAKQELRKRATIYDVAEAAGVSHQTVSRLIKGSSNIRSDLRESIERAIVDLNFRPNVTARSLATRRRNVLGVLTARAYEYGPTQTLVGIRAAAEAAGFLVDVVAVDPARRSDVDSAIGVFRSRDLAGLLAIAPADALLQAVQGIALDVPVHIWQEADDRIEDSHLTINGFGQDQLVAHLRALGHTSFASISGPADWVSARNRQAGLVHSLARHGLEHASTAEGNWSAESGHRAMRRLGRSFTALVAANDQMALGAILALEDAGISVPQQVSVVGFDDVPEAAFFRPPLTTVRQDFVHQGRVAFSRLLAEIRGDSTPQLTQNAPSLVVRRSSARACS